MKYWSLIQDENLRFSLEDPARTPLIVAKCSDCALVFRRGTFDHARRLKAPFVLPPRPGRRTHCAGTGGVATLPRAVPRNVPRPPQLSGERRGAASGSFGESPTSCTAYRGEFSAPEAFVPHAARRDEVRAGGPNLGPPRSHRSPKH